MQIEFEIKVLDIDIEFIKNKLDKLGSKYIWRKEFKRYAYDFKPACYEKWIRLRTDWETTTLCTKEIIDESKIDWTKELEVTVDSFENTNELLQKIWYDFRAYQENIRISYTLDDCEIEIDQRPMIPTYLEIEWKNKESVENILKKLDLDDHIQTSENTSAVYRRYGISDMEAIKELKF